MEWSRSETIGLSLHSCTKCNGLGITKDRAGLEQACKCSLRGIFRICYNRFRQCVEQDPRISRTSIEPSFAGQKRPSTWGRKNEEYIADFEVVTRRTLDEEEHRLFRYHFYLGADWRLCCRKLNIDRGAFFHLIYRMEEKLGKVFREMRPYSLYPLEDYFGGTSCWPESASEEWRKTHPTPLAPVVAIARRPAQLQFPKPANPKPVNKAA